MGVIGTWLEEIGAAFDPAIFIAQLFGFAVIIFLLWKYVRPPIQRMMKDRQDTVREQLSEAEAAKKRVVEAKSAHERAIKEAKAESVELQESAKADAEAIAADMSAQADHEVKRISEHGKAQVSLHRANLLRELRTELGLAAVDRAGSLVRGHLSDPSAQSETVDRVIDELESMSGSRSTDDVATSADLIGLHSMRAASRESALEVSSEFDGATKDLDAAALDEAAEELAAVVTVLNANPVLRKKLSESTDNPQAKESLARGLFEGKVSAPVLTTVVAASTGRWSSTADFIAGLRRQTALAVLIAADRDGQIDQVEDELFRVSRLLEANPKLAALLSDHTADADKRVDLLKTLVGEQVGTQTWYLLSHTIRLLHGQASDVAVEQLAELAAGRRGESVAQVVSAAELTDAQRERLTSVLGTIYGRTISIQTEVRPELLGGLRIAVGDEVIDADIATRLAKAAETLPR